MRACWRIPARTARLFLPVLLWLASASAPQAGITPPPNDSCANAVVISTAPFMDTGVTAAGTTEPADPVPNCGNGSRDKSVWYRFTTPSAGMLTADTFDSDYDTILSVYTGSCGTLNPVPDQCNDDDPFDGAQSKVSFLTPAGTTYYFMISAFEGDGGTVMFRLRFFLIPATATPTPTRASATRTPTPTPSPTPDLSGDANCDGHVNAPDLPALLLLISAGERAPCRRDDVNRDGALDARDATLIIEAIFSRER